MIGDVAPAVRARAREQGRSKKTPQIGLFSTGIPDRVRYEQLHLQELVETRASILRSLREVGSLKFEAIWPELLEQFHVTEQDVVNIVGDLRKEDIVEINLEPRKRRVRDHHIITLRAPPLFP